MNRMNAAFALFIYVVAVFLMTHPAESQQNHDLITLYKDYAAILTSFVDDNGMVNYRGLEKNKDALTSFVSFLSTVPRSAYDRWNRQGKIAFWVNCYNAMTLHVIVDHYPIKASLITSLVYPKNSIRQISGAWDKITFSVFENEVTLDDIEHQILRAEFDEPRIHMALVCAAMGCPPLRNEPYYGDNLAVQLDDQTRSFLADPQKFRIDTEKKRVYLSSIFKWFGKDFISKYSADEVYSGHSPEEQAVLNFAGSYLGESDSRFLQEDTYRISYIDYDWSLNEQ